MKVSAEMNIRFTIYKYIKNEKRPHMKERKIGIKKKIQIQLDVKYFQADRRSREALPRIM